MTVEVHKFTKKDFWLAVILAILGFALLAGLRRTGGYTYFETAARELVTRRTVFLTEPVAWLVELVPTTRGYIFVFPPLGLIATLPFVLAGLSERWLQLFLGGVIVGTTYLLSLGLGGGRARATVVAIMMACTTPLLWMGMFAGSWFTAHLLAFALAQLALLAGLRHWYRAAGVAAGLAILSRLSLGMGAVAAVAYLSAMKKKWTAVIVPVAAALIAAWAWNWYRFGSLHETGYDLIPGVLTEPWYQNGIMNWRYIGPNWWRYLTQVDFLGHGIGLAWSQPYLLLLPLVGGIYWPLTLVGLGNYLLVLAHGGYGWVQYDFRYLMDALWIWLPLLTTLPRRWWRLGLILGLVALLVHLPLMGICIIPESCWLDRLPVSMEY